MVNSSEFCPTMKLKALKAIEHVKSFLVLAIIALALTVIPLSPPVSAQPLNSWSSTTSYPTGIASQSCATNSGFIYCVGGTTFPTGITDAVYFAPITSSGVGPWASTTSYPVLVAEQSCVTDSGFIYCVGGGTNAVFFATISSSGVGTWNPTTSYPISIFEQSCVTNSGSIYCVGGLTTSSPFITNAVFFAPISSSGVGTWNPTTSYPLPIFEQSCVARASFVYCVGGQANPSVFSPGPTIDVFFAPISSSGVGTWTTTTSYPLPISEQSCVTRAALTYCVGGNPPIPISAVFFG